MDVQYTLLRVINLIFIQLTSNFGVKVCSLLESSYVSFSVVVTPSVNSTEVDVCVGCSNVINLVRWLQYDLQRWWFTWLCRDDISSSRKGTSLVLCFVCLFSSSFWIECSHCIVSSCKQYNVDFEEFCWTLYLAGRGFCQRVQECSTTYILTAAVQ